MRSEFSFLVSYKNKSQVEDSKPKPITIKSYSSRGVELLPSMKVISQGNKSLVFIIDQVACHSYFNIPVSRDSVMRIASLDTLITLYFSLGLVDSSFFDMGSMECLANKLVDISLRARKNPNGFPLPFISIKCTGHQTSLPSLIRQKVKRITQKKQEIKQLLQKANVNKNRNRRNTIKTNKNTKLFDEL